MELLKNFQIQSNLDFWKEPWLGQPADIMVPASRMSEVNDWLSSHNIKFSLMVENVQESKILRRAQQFGQFSVGDQYQSLIALGHNMVSRTDVLFEFHLKFWNTTRNGISVRSLLLDRQTSNWSNCSSKRNNISSPPRTTKLY